MPLPASAVRRRAKCRSISARWRRVRDARRAELVRERVEHRPVGGDVGAPRGIAHDIDDCVDEPVETLEAARRGPAIVRPRIRRVDELGRQDRVAVRAHPLEDGRADEDVGRLDAAGGEVGVTGAGGERERRDDRVELPQPHEPPGDRMLDRCEAGEEGGHGGGRGRREDRGHGAAQRRAKRRRRPDFELRPAEPVDDEEHDVPRVRDLPGLQIDETAVHASGRRRIESGKDGLHQVHDAAVTIVRQMHRDSACGLE